MTSQSGGGGIPLTQTVGGVLSGNILTPSFAAGSVPAELGYVQVTANQTGISATVLTDLTGLTLTVLVGSRAIMIEGYIYQIDAGATAGALCLITLFDVTASAEVQRCAVDTGDASGGFGNPKVRLTPSAGSRTYKMQARGDGVTVGRILASATDPAWLRIYEV